LPRSFGWRYLMRAFPISFLCIWRRSRCSSEESKHGDAGDCCQNVQQSSKRVAVALAENRPADFWKEQQRSSGPISTLSEGRDTMTTISAKSDVMTLINVFTVEPANQRRLVELLTEATEFSAGGFGPKVREARTCGPNPEYR
jgi:hypothetical protein